MSPKLVAIPRLKELSQPYYIPIAGRRTGEFMPFHQGHQHELKQTVSSRIRTQFAGFIFMNDDNHYTTYASMQQRNINIVCKCHEECPNSS